MRSYSPSFSYANLASEKYPRFVVGILFDTDPLYFTSHAGIPNVPGVVIDNVLTVKDARSVRIYPDEGRSEIGVVNFDLLDLDGAVTDAFRAKLTANAGLRGKKVVLYHGWKGADFTTFQVFQTQVVLSDSYNRGVYSIKCNDISREQRKDLFDPKSTRLTSTIEADATTITVASTAAFQMIAHGTSYEADASSTVGYLQIEDEKISYTGTTATTFTGCTRGALNTRAVQHTVDVSTPPDQTTEVKEVIYLQMPLPKLILAILTGNIYGQSATLPSHWHLGIDPVWVRESDFTGIGLDLWNPDSDSTSFVPRFLDLKKTDGKKFLETECYMLAGCYPLIYSDGTVGIKRMNRILFDASFVGVLDQTNVESWSALTHDMESVANDYRVEWNFVDGNATRITELFDGISITVNGAAPQKDLKFQGLYGSRHTDSTVRARLDSLRDRYANPPALMTIMAMPHLNVLEVGDIVRVRLPLVRDYSKAGTSLDRSMEVQGTSINLRTGDVNLTLFGSTGLASTSAPDWDGSGTPPSTTPIPDTEGEGGGFYDSEGTDLATVLDLTQVGDVWVVDDGEYDLPGNADATNDAAIYYFTGGDLQIQSGVTLNITDNVQLRIKGFLEVNGEIIGIGAGKAGIADTTGYGTTTTGTPGFGSTRGMNGIGFKSSILISTVVVNINALTTKGVFDVLPAYDLQISSDDPPLLLGLPTDLRGTSGGAGGKFVRVNNSPHVDAVGGTGGNSGAGLILISRGLSVGVGGSINLSGGDTDTPADAASSLPVAPRGRPGAGAPGCPGALLIVLDGQDLSYPDLSGGRFLAITGASGAPRTNVMSSPTGGGSSALFTGTGALEGYLDPATTDSQDMSNSAFRVIYLASIASPAEDQPPGAPAPTGLTVDVFGPAAVSIAITLATLDQFNNVELWRSATNDRTAGSRLGNFSSTIFQMTQPASSTYYYWIRAAYYSPLSIISDWYPSSATAGVACTTP